MTKSQQILKLQNKADEISVRVLLLKLISYARSVMRKWYWVLLGALLCGGYYYYNAAQLVQTYPARIKLFVSPPKVDKNNAELIEAFSRLMNTQQMFIKIFLKTQDLTDPSSLIINSYLSTYYDTNPNGLPDGIPLGFQIKHNTLETMDTEERRVLNKVISKVTTPVSDFSDGFISISGDFKMGFITINVSSPTEELSILLLEELYHEIEFLLLGNAVFANEAAYVNFSIETDSLAQAYKQLYFDLNKYIDRRERLSANKETVSDKDVAEIKYLEKEIHRLSAEAEISKTGYLASLEQQKIAQLDRDQNAISIEELERTFAPIPPYKPSAVIAGIKGGLLGGIGVVVLIILLLIFTEIKQELSEV